MRFIGPIVSSIVELLSDYPQISNSMFEMFISQRELVCWRSHIKKEYG